MTDDSRFDLSSLDPSADPVRLTRSIAAVMARSGSELARRRAAGSVLGQLAWWERPMLIAAAILGLAALSTLALVEPGGLPAEAETTWSSAMGVPSHLTDWVERGQAPSLESALGFPVEAP